MTPSLWHSDVYKPQLNPRMDDLTFRLSPPPISPTTFLLEDERRKKVALEEAVKVANIEELGLRELESLHEA